jgi:ADP-ribose pyrophosphatase
MSRPWLQTSAAILLKTRVFAVRALRRQSPRDGQTHEFWVIDAPDWVNIVALTPDNQLVLIDQWRHGSESVTIEVPGGMIDPGETPLLAAQRELLEETGFASDEWLQIGVVLPNPAIQSNRCTTFLARNCRQVAATHFDTTEECVLRLVPAATAADLIRDGSIDHAIVIAALSFAFLHGYIPDKA